MITVVIPARERKARGLCSRWLKEQSPGVFVGVLHRSARDRLLWQMSQMRDVKAFWEQSGRIVVWASPTVTDRTA